MSKLSQMTVTMNDMQEQLKALSSVTKNPTRTKIKLYCQSYRSNFTHGSKTCSAKKTRHKEEAYYKKRMGIRETGCELWLWEIIIKIRISNPKTSLINCIGTPPNSPGKNVLEIADSGANIHLSKQATATMAPVITSSDMTSRLPDGSTM